MLKGTLYEKADGTNVPILTIDGTYVTLYNPLKAYIEPHEDGTINILCYEPVRYKGYKLIGHINFSKEKIKILEPLSALYIFDTNGHTKVRKKKTNVP